jgi:ATP-dependent RNA helicase MSS116
VLMMFNACRRGPASITRVFRATTSTARIPSTRPSSLSLSFQTPARPALEARWLHVSSQFKNQAAAVRHSDEDRVGKAPPQFREINKFQQLIEHDMVHPNVVEEITRGMGHHTMTEVQTLTINQGLQGTDM